MMAHLGSYEAYLGSSKGHDAQIRQILIHGYILAQVRHSLAQQGHKLAHVGTQSAIFVQVRHTLAEVGHIV
jgi:hypothetical protein